MQSEKIPLFKFHEYLLTDFQRDMLRDTFVIKILLAIAIMLILTFGFCIGIKLDYIMKTMCL